MASSERVIIFPYRDKVSGPRCPAIDCEVRRLFFCNVCKGGCVEDRCLLRSWCVGCRDRLVEQAERRGEDCGGK